MGTSPVSEPYHVALTDRFTALLGVVGVDKKAYPRG
jgi:hypothetical protein